MNIIWNENELKKIKPILLKYNLKLDEDNTIVENEQVWTGVIPHQHNIDKKYFEKVFYVNNKSEILKVLKSLVGVKFLVKKNPNYPIFNGLINDMSKMDPLDATEIFNLLDGLNLLYKRNSMKIASTITDTLKDPELIKKKINEIKNSETETKEEVIIKHNISKILKYTNGIFNNDFFIELINDNNSNIKDNLLSDLNKRLRNISSRIENAKESPIRSYVQKEIEKNKTKGRYYSGEHNME